MNKLLAENLPWKITSVILAFLLWLFVINTQNPIQPQEISGVNIVITGINELEAAGYKLRNQEEIKNQQFKVVVTGPRLEIDKLIREPGLITVTLNMEQYMENLDGNSLTDSANYTVKMDLDSYSVSVTDKKAAIDKVIIDKIEKKEQKVNYEISTKLTDTYTLIDDEVPVISPGKVVITGAKGDIDRVSEARVFLDTKDFSDEKLIASLPVKLYDAEGVEIVGLNINPEAVEVKLPIGSEKEVPVKLSYTGELKEGLVLVNTIISPEKVKIIGTAERLSSISEIILDPIDLTNINKTDLIEIAMKLPDGVMTLEESKVRVSLEIEEKEELKYPVQTSEMKLEVIGLEEGLSYEILTPVIEITLSAIPNKLLNYDKEDITFVLDLTGYSIGEYTLPIVAKTEPDITVVDEVINVDIKIDGTGQVPEETPIPTPTIEPTATPDID